MEVTVKLDLSEADRANIEGAMSNALGAYIQSMSEADGAKIDFSNWVPEEWQRFVQIGFDVAAFEVFKRRVLVLGPKVDEPF